MAKLQIRFQGAQTVVPLGDGETSIGRSNTCTIRVPDPDLAPVHFRIEKKGASYRLKDDGSGHPTRVNGRPVYATALQDGDRIEAGGLTCTYLEREKAPPAGPPPERRAPAPPRPDRTGLVLALVGGIAAVALAGYFLLGGSGSDATAKSLWQRANAALERSRKEPAKAEAFLKEADTDLQELLEKAPQSSLASAAADARAEVEGTLSDLKSLQELQASVASLSPPEIDAAFTKLAKLRRARSHPAIVGLAETVDAALRKKASEGTDAAWGAISSKSKELVAEKRFGEALRLYKTPGNAPYVLQTRVAKGKKELLARIQSEYDALLSLSARAKDLDARIALLQASRPEFRDTPQASDLEVRIAALVERRARNLQREGKRPPEKTEKPKKVPAPQGPYRDPPGVALLLKERRYPDAAALVAKEGKGKGKGLEVRVEELKLCARLLASLANDIAQDPGKFRAVVLRKGLGDASGANATSIRVVVGDAARSIPWKDLPARAFPRLFRQAGLLGSEPLACALFYEDAGLSEDAEKSWVDADHAAQTAEEQERLFAIVARRRGVAVPEGGFVLFRGKLVAPAERDKTLFSEKLATLAREARSHDDRHRKKAWEELKALGAPARETLVAAVRARRELLVKELEASPAFQKQRAVAVFSRELPQRRKDALDFILDPKKYPYPNKTVASQKEAERLVARVREICDQPYYPLLKVSKTAEALDTELVALDKRLRDMEGDDPAEDRVAAWVAKDLDVAHLPLDDQDRKRLQYNEQVKQYNKDVPDCDADKEERTNVAVVNAYRGMMGLYALKIDERLVRCARKHSLEMQKLGYFAHESPTPSLRTPTLRARHEKYPGGVSENIAEGMSTGQAAFVAWFHSSGHHRNMLMPGWTEMGCGEAAHNWWTQNFGSATGRSMTPPKIPPDPDAPQGKG